MFTNEEIVYQVSKHLLTQKRRSVNGSNDVFYAEGTPDASVWCAYRSKTGLKCAVGCLIPDDMYDPMIEGAYSTFSANPPNGEKRNSKNLLRRKIYNYLGGHETSDLLDTLQAVHDTRDHWDEDGLNDRGQQALLGVVHTHGMLDAYTRARDDLRQAAATT